MTTISVKLLAGIVAVLTSGVVFLGAYSGKVNVSVAPAPEVFGAISGPNVTEEMFLMGNVTIGGRVIASSTVGTATLLVSDIKGVKLFNSKAASAASLTFPSKTALTSAGFLPSVGDTAEWFIHASTSAITLVGATGVNLQSNASTTIVYPLKTAKVTFTRLPVIEGFTIEAVISGMY